MKHVLLILALIFISSCAYSQQVEDWIYFKDSTLVKGLVTEIKEGGIEVETAEGPQKFRLHTVARIVKQNPELMKRKDNNQTQRGTFKISGMFSFSALHFNSSGYVLQNNKYVLKDIDNSYSSFRLNPSVIYFFRDNFGAGITLNMEVYSDEGMDSPVFGSKAGFIAQYYFLSGSIRPYIDAEMLGSIWDKKRGYQLLMGAGLNFAMAKNIALQPMFQYGRESDKGAKPENVFFYSLGLACFLY